MLRYWYFYQTVYGLEGSLGTVRHLCETPRTIANRPEWDRVPLLHTVNYIDVQLNQSNSHS